MIMPILQLRNPRPEFSNCLEILLPIQGLCPGSLEAREVTGLYPLGSACEKLELAPGLAEEGRLQESGPLMLGNLNQRG